MNRINYNLIYKKVYADIEKMTVAEALADIYGRIKTVLTVMQYSDAQRVRIIESITKAFDDKIALYK